MMFKVARGWIAGMALGWLLLIAGGSVRAQECWSQSRSRAVVTLLPASGPESRWTWNSEERTRMQPLGCASVDGNIWSVARGVGQGAVTMTSAPGSGLATQIHLSQFQNAGYIIGYPEILYGYKPFGHTLSREVEPLSFPMPARVLPDLWAVTEYDVQASDPQLPMDLAYDLWFSKVYKPTGMQKGDVELMVFLAHRNLAPAGKLFAARGFQTTVWMNGRRQEATFDVYVTDPTLPNHTSVIVSFVLRRTSAAGELTGGVPSGYVGLDLRVLAEQMIRVLHEQYGWSEQDLSNEYINGVELGSEFARHGPEADLGWQLKHDCLVVPASTRTAEYSSWGTFVCP